jgi:hypothetical protein
LIASTILSLNPQLGASSFPILIIGVAFSTLGIRLSREWTRAPFSHDVLLSSLKGLPAENILMNYWNPTNHILLTTDAIYILTSFQGEADLSITPTAWTDTSSFITQARRVLALETISRTRKLAHANVLKVTKWLEQHFPDNQFPICSCVVFINSNTHLSVEGQPTPFAVYADKRKPNLKMLVRTQPPGASLVPIDKIASLIQTTV